MKYRVINEAVLYNDESLCTMTKNDLYHLAELGFATQEQRTRLCVHERPDALVHEMFIIHTADTYVRPHRHRQKSESFQVLEGEASLVLFNHNGELAKVIELGNIATDKIFYFKMPAKVWHMLLIHSDVLVFKEVTQGPFDSDDCEFPDWAPPGRHCSEVPDYLHHIREQIARHDRTE